MEDQVVKNNDCVLDGLTIRTEESNISPTVYLNPYFEQIQDGAEMDDVLGQIAATYQAHYIDQDMDVSAVTDFDNVKDKIVCKLITDNISPDHIILFFHCLTNLWEEQIISVCKRKLPSLIRNGSIPQLIRLERYLFVAYSLAIFAHPPSTF